MKDFTVNNIRRQIIARLATGMFQNDVEECCDPDDQGVTNQESRVVTRVIEDCINAIKEASK